MILPILQYPDPLLRKACEPVELFDADLEKLAKDMLETMYEAPGVGLAAPQVGDTRRIFVLDVSDKSDSPLVFVNPEIVQTSAELIDSEEGCLSIVDYRATIKRHAEVRVRAQDVFGNPFELDAEELFSRCIQHELDHLNGKLFVDRLSAVRKPLFRSWLKKHGIQGE